MKESVTNKRIEEILQTESYIQPAQAPDDLYEKVLMRLAETKSTDVVPLNRPRIWLAAASFLLLATVNLWAMFGTQSNTNTDLAAQPQVEEYSFLNNNEITM